MPIFHLNKINNEMMATYIKEATKDKEALFNIPYLKQTT